MKNRLCILVATAALLGASVASGVNANEVVSNVSLISCDGSLLDPMWGRVSGRVTALHWSDVAINGSIHIDVVTGTQDTVRLSVAFLKHLHTSKMGVKEWGRQITVFGLTPGDSVVASGLILQRIDQRITILQLDSLALVSHGPSNTMLQHGLSADCVVVEGRLANLIAAVAGNTPATTAADLITAERDTLHFIYPDTVHCNPGTFESIPGFKPGGLMRIYVKQEDLEAARYRHVTIERAEADCAIDH